LAPTTTNQIINERTIYIRKRPFVEIQLYRVNAWLNLDTWRQSGHDLSEEAQLEINSLLNEHGIRSVCNKTGFFVGVPTSIACELGLAIAKIARSDEMMRCGYALREEMREPRPLIEFFDRKGQRIDPPSHLQAHSEAM
jgi:hypothetical protein